MYRLNSTHLSHLVDSCNCTALFMGRCGATLVSTRFFMFIDPNDSYIDSGRLIYQSRSTLVDSSIDTGEFMHETWTPHEYTIIEFFIVFVRAKIFDLSNISALQNWCLVDPYGIIKFHLLILGRYMIAAFQNCHRRSKMFETKKFLANFIDSFYFCENDAQKRLWHER